MECIYEVKSENLMEKTAVDDFTKDILALTDDAKFDRIVLDMKGVVIIGSFCIGTIMGAFRAMESKDGKLVLKNLSVKAKKTFEILNLMDVLSVR